MDNLNKDLKTKELKPYYLLYGTESYLINYFKSEFKKIFNDNPELNIIEIKDAIKDAKDENNLINNIIKMPFFSDKKLIIIDDINLNGEGIREALERAKDINIVLYLIHSEKYRLKEDKKNTVLDLFEEKGYICELNEQDEKTLATFVKNRLKQNEKVISDSNLSYLIDRIGHDLYNIISEIDKLVSFVGGRQEINKDDIEKVTKESIEDEAFNMVNYLNQNNKEKAYEIYGRLLTDPSFSSMQLYGALKYNYLTILKLKALLNREINGKEIMKMMNINSKFRFDKLKDVAVNNTIEYFRDKVERLYECNKKFMTGLINDNVFVELMIS